MIARKEFINISFCHTHHHSNLNIQPAAVIAMVKFTAFSQVRVQWDKRWISQKRVQLYAKKLLWITHSKWNQPDSFFFRSVLIIRSIKNQQICKSIPCRKQHYSIVKLTLTMQWIAIKPSPPGGDSRTWDSEFIQPIFVQYCYPSDMHRYFFIGWKQYHQI